MKRQDAANPERFWKLKVEAPNYLWGLSSLLNIGCCLFSTCRFKYNGVAAIRTFASNVQMKWVSRSSAMACIQIEQRTNRKKADRCANINRILESCVSSLQRDPFHPSRPYPEHSRTLERHNLSRCYPSCGWEQSLQGCQSPHWQSTGQSSTAQATFEACSPHQYDRHESRAHRKRPTSQEFCASVFSMGKDEL